MIVPPPQRSYFCCCSTLLMFSSWFYCVESLGWGHQIIRNWPLLLFGMMSKILFFLFSFDVVFPLFLKRFRFGGEGRSRRCSDWVRDWKLLNGTNRIEWIGSSKELSSGHRLSLSPINLRESIMSTVPYVQHYCTSHHLQEVFYYIGNYYWKRETGITRRTHDCDPRVRAMLKMPMASKNESWMSISYCTPTTGREVDPFYISHYTCREGYSTRHRKI